MRTQQHEQSVTTRIRRHAAPARAREVIQQNAESLTVTNADSGSAAAAALDPRITELRARVKDGSYQVDLQELSRKIIQDHLEGKER